MAKDRDKQEELPEAQNGDLRRKHAQLTDELREKSVLLETVLNAIPDVIGIQDPNHLVLRYNDAGYNFLGMTPDQVSGKHCFELIGQEVACNECATSQAKRTGQAARIEKYYEERGLWLDVRAYPIKDDQGHVVQIVEHMRDITQERRAAEELTRVRNRLDAVLRSIPYPLFVKDRQGRYLMCNPAFETFFGIAQANLVGKKTHECWPSEDAEVYHEKDQELLAEGAVQVYEHRLADAGGESHDIIFTKARFSDEAGQIAGIVGTLTDITDRKRVESDLRQAQKMETVGQLAGGVAHDFNNLLSPILGYSEMLLSDLPHDAPHREQLEIIRRAADRAKGLTRQLLAFSRRQILEFQAVRLNQIVHDFHKMLRRTLREDIEIQLDLQPGAGSVEADPVQLDQVLMNLAINAQDAMPNGGRLVFSTVRQGLDSAGDPKMPGWAPGEHVLLKVSDTGQGIEPETLSRIFEPFFTTKKVGQGTGLGLATVYGIVKQHGGQIEVQSQPDQGTTFLIRLPRVEPQQAGTYEQAIDTQGLKGDETIVVVEDDPMVRNLAGQILERFGYRVELAASGQACLDLLSDAATPVNLLLTDVIMPDLNGRELSIRLLESRPELKVIFMSGYTGDVIARHGVLVAGNAYLQKPFTVLGLVRKVRSVLDD